MTEYDAVFDWHAAQIDVDGFDAARSRMTRLWNLWAGGKDALGHDLQVTDQARQEYPPIVRLARYRLAFRSRVVRTVVGECGLDQLLVAGTDLPLHSEVHEIAHQLNPRARVVYADAEAWVRVHAEALLVPAPGCVCGYVTAGLDDPAALLEGAAGWLDLDRPVGVLMLNSLDVCGDRVAAAAMQALRAALAPGSVLAICHLVDGHDDATALLEAMGAGEYPYLALPRNRAAIGAFLAGTRLLPPGIVPVSRWRPEVCWPGEPDTAALWCGLGQLPGPDRGTVMVSQPAVRPSAPDG